jgi:hypothetical protein
MKMVTTNPKRTKEGGIDMSKRDVWTPIGEMDKPDGTHTCWVRETTKEDNCEIYPYIWITMNAEGKFDVEVDYGTFNGEFTKLTTCKSLAGAKRYVTMSILNKRERFRLE